MTKRFFAGAVLMLCLAVLTDCNNEPGNSKTQKVSRTTNDKKMDKEQLTKFGKNYSAAWSSQKPGSVAAFFSLNGSLKVNADSPAIGRDAITEIARGFMTAFPDMIVAMDSLIIKPGGTAFHWTLTGTNSGPGGTGHKVRISGVEVWTLSEDGLIEKSIGSFDGEEYSRQLKEGIK